MFLDETHTLHAALQVVMPFIDALEYFEYRYSIPLRIHFMEYSQPLNFITKHADVGKGCYVNQNFNHFDEQL